jgi:hypothetical protein
VERYIGQLRVNFKGTPTYLGARPERFLTLKAYVALIGAVGPEAD